MNNIFKRLAANLSVCVALAATPTLAQTINADESATHFATVRGWNVYVVSDGRGIFACRAVRGSGYNDQIMISHSAYNSAGASPTWSVLVQGHRQEFDGPDNRGAGAYYDNTFVDRQIFFGFPGRDGDSNSHARLNIEGYELGMLKNRNRFTLDIRDEAKRTYSLSGSTAAILKVADCAESYGIAPAGFAASMGPKPKPKPAASQGNPAQNVMPMVDGTPIGNVRYPGGDFVNIGRGHWQEKIDDGVVINFYVFDSTSSSVFLEDPLRNLQIWIDLPSYQINITHDHDYNRWERLYQIECFAGLNKKHC